MPSIPADATSPSATVSMASTALVVGVVDLTDDKPADQPDQLRNVWEKGYAKKCVVGGKLAWKCPWYDKLHFPQHTTRLLFCII